MATSSYRTFGAGLEVWGREMMTWNVTASCSRESRVTRCDRSAAETEGWGASAERNGRRLGGTASALQSLDVNESIARQPHGIN